MAETRAERAVSLRRTAPSTVDGPAITDIGGGRTGGVRGVEERFSVEVSGHRSCRLTVAGELDYRTAPMLERALLEATGGDCVVDCTGLTFIASIGIAAFVQHKSRCDADGRRFMMTNLGGAPRRTIEICGLLDLFESGRG